VKPQREAGKQSKRDGIRRGKVGNGERYFEEFVKRQRVTTYSSQRRTSKGKEVGTLGLRAQAIPRLIF